MFGVISWKFYPSPKICYTSATCDKCHFCNDNDNDNENANNLDLSQGHWHGNQAKPEVGQWEIEDEKVPEKVVFNIESGGKKSQLSCASEQMRPWMEKCLAFLSRGRRRTARSTARFSQAPTEICLFQFLFCDAVLYWARPESCIFCHFLTMYPGPVIILMWLHLWWKRCRWSGWPSSLREGGWSKKNLFIFIFIKIKLVACFTCYQFQAVKCFVFDAKNLCRKWLNQDIF